MSYFLKIKAVVALIFFAGAILAQTAHQDLRAADKAYEANNLSVAEAGYRKAIEKENSAKGNYNLGNTTYRQEHYDESIKHYQAAADAAKDRTTKARAYHNLGNALYQKGQYKESVDAYKNALRQNPNDIDTKRNLANAMRHLPPPPPKQQNQPKQNNKKQQKNQPPPLDSPPKNNDKSYNPQPKDKNGKPEDLSKQEAKDLLDIMDREEQKVQQKLKKAQARNKKSVKDW
ncbi:MAG: tetratricopeptide repeat protein [Bacteroidetes bacterium]|nr:tetratricopeptide repeat protein [Bacteroidota bacterium]